MRRLPIYVLLDCSESMIGTGLEALQRGIKAMLTALQRNPHALETAWISFITFDARAEVACPLVAIDEAKAPTLRARPGTCLGGALLLLSERILSEVKRNQPDVKGDFRPLVVLITDGQSTDEWRTPLKELNSTVSIGNFYAIGAGDDIDFSELRSITDIVLNLRETDEQSWAKLFVWISDTLATASVGTAEGGEKDAMLAKLPSVVEKVQAEDWERRPSGPPRQLFIMGLCGKTRLPYLMRYRFDDIYECYEPVCAHLLEPETSDFGQRGGGLPSVDSGLVNGCPTCPRCGSEGAGSCGNCGTVFCGGARRPDGTSLCPGCNNMLNASRGGGSFRIKISEG